ncbi:TPA: hypothetical protein ACXIGC_000504 [Stenotrophomonas maltophilia]|uniref:hypothetical protein n=1 Tax=Stenotrophomonas maltophilia TaxID=40324 RepID=UPI000C14DF1A|nr:hypothetical protein [Stenotrophomonas maltophilia]MBH1825934.1 hypothetical protein [Stenotrophomonas maltophilia]HEL5579539.1 hypothetical protein [Stenotrophomonas maltophilia]
MTTAYRLHPRQKEQPLVDTIHEVRIDSPSKKAFQSLAKVQRLSMRAALTQLIEQHAEIRKCFSPRRPRPWAGIASSRRCPYDAALPEVEVSTSASLALLIDANRAGIRLAEAVRQLVWRCVQASE